MTKFDLNNLKFFLTANQETLLSWYQLASDSDLIYAGNLFDRYAKFLESEAKFIEIEKSIANMPVFVEAQAVIAAVQ